MKSHNELKSVIRTQKRIPLSTEGKNLEEAHSTVSWLSKNGTQLSPLPEPRVHPLWPPVPTGFKLVALNSSLSASVEELVTACITGASLGTSDLLALEWIQLSGLLTGFENYFDSPHKALSIGVGL